MNNIIKKLGLLIMIGLLVSCSSSKKKNDKEITFAFWDATLIPGYEKAAKVFEKNNEGVKIKFINQTWDEYWQTLNNQAQTNTLPDIVTMHVNTFSSFAKSKALLPLDDIFSKYGDKYNIEEDDFSGMETFKQDGIQYAFPRDNAYFTMMYDKELFDKYDIDYPEIGWTYDDFLETLKSLKEKLPTGVYPIYNVSDAQTSYYAEIIQHGGILPTKVGTYSDPNTQKGVDSWWNLTNKYQYSPKPSKVEERMQEFINGKFAMLPVGTWEYQNIIEVPEFVEKTAITTMPSVVENENIALYNNNSSAITKSCKNPELAMEFLAFLHSEEATKIAMETTNLIGSFKGDYTELFSEKYSMYPNFNEIYELTSEHGFHSPLLRAGVNDILREYNAKILEESNYEKAMGYLKEMSTKIDEIYNLGE